MAVISSAWLDRSDLRVASQSELLLQANSWVKLHQPLSAYSFDEALLLCECPDGRWIAWVPDFGEVLLSVEQFALGA